MARGSIPRQVVFMSWIVRLDGGASGTRYEALNGCYAAAEFGFDGREGIAFRKDRDDGLAGWEWFADVGEVGQAGPVAVRIPLTGHFVERRWCDAVLRGIDDGFAGTAVARGNGN